MLEETPPLFIQITKLGSVLARLGNSSKPQLHRLSLTRLIKHSLRLAGLLSLKSEMDVEGIVKVLETLRKLRNYRKYNFNDRKLMVQKAVA